MTLLSEDIRKEGLLGQLRRVDKSFQQRQKNDFRAFTSDGYFVDLIRPESNPFERQQLTKLGQSDDLEGAPIFGLQWLINVPRFEAPSDRGPMEIYKPGITWCGRSAWMSLRPRGMRSG